MAKIIINIADEKIELQQALECVRQVVSEGKISEDNYGVKQFCWTTKFRNGLTVFTNKKHGKTAADSFTVTKD